MRQINMILYVTKKTKERLNIPMINDLSENNRKFATRVDNNEKKNR